MSPGLFKLSLVYDRPAIPLVSTGKNTWHNTNTEVAIRPVQDLIGNTIYSICECMHMCAIPILCKYMGIHLVVMGNSGFPPLWQLGDWLPEAGRKVGVWWEM